MRHSRFPFLFASLLALCGVPLGAAQSTAPLIGEFDARRALIEVYGSLEVDSILAERGRELRWEAKRRTDLVRFGRFTGGAYIWEWKGGVQAGTTTDGHYDLYPIPANELNANPNLKQNPGY